MWSRFLCRSLLLLFFRLRVKEHKEESLGKHQKGEMNTVCVRARARARRNRERREKRGMGRQRERDKENENRRETHTCNIDIG